MKPLVARLVLLAVLFLSLAAGPALQAQEPQSAATGFDSPEAAYAAARDAFNAEDWDAFVATVSPARLDEVIGQMAVALAGMAQQPGSDPRLSALVDQYLPRNFDPMDLMMSDNAQAETIRLAKRMGDAQGFFVEAMSLIFSMQYSPAELAPAEDEELATLEDAADDDTKQPLDAQITAMDELTIEDNRAEAKVTITTSTGDQHDRWTFEQHEGRWYLSMR
ncbi:MAG: hypothetical protein AAF333_14670 [Planctomycetota bacterium]